MDDALSTSSSGPAVSNSHLPAEFRLPRRQADYRLPLSLFPEHGPMRPTPEIVEAMRERRQKLQVAKQHFETKMRRVFHFSVVSWRYAVCKSLQWRDFFGREAVEVRISSDRDKTKSNIRESFTEEELWRYKVRALPRWSGKRALLNVADRFGRRSWLATRVRRCDGGGFSSHAELMCADYSSWTYDKTATTIQRLNRKWGEWYRKQLDLDAVEPARSSTSSPHSSGSYYGVADLQYFTEAELCRSSRQCQDALLVVDADLEKLIGFIADVAGVAVKLFRADDQSAKRKRTICLHLGATRGNPFLPSFGAPSGITSEDSRARAVCYHTSHVPPETDVPKDPLPWAGVWNVQAPQIHHLRTNTHVRLLSLADLQALLHELGHAFHFCLSAHKYEELRVMAEDRMEIPSTSLEYLVRDPDFLRHVIEECQATTLAAAEVDLGDWFRAQRVEHWDLIRNAALFTSLFGKDGLPGIAADKTKSMRDLFARAERQYVDAHCGGISPPPLQRSKILTGAAGGDRPSAFHPLGVPELVPFFTHENAPLFSLWTHQVLRWWRDDRKWLFQNVPSPCASAFLGQMVTIAASPVVLLHSWADWIGQRFLPSRFYRTPFYTVFQTHVPHAVAKLHAFETAAKEDFLLSFYRDYWLMRDGAGFGATGAARGEGEADSVLEGGEKAREARTQEEGSGDARRDEQILIKEYYELMTSDKPLSLLRGGEELPEWKD
eukprot:g15989.t1